MQRVRTALYLDFDNVFSGLMKLDPAAAVAFADKPRVWLDRLADTLLVDGPRRWLVVRCYLNPGGSVSSPGPDAANGRIYFSRFRPSFTDAGFDVVDCPRLAHTKNAADIRMVVDALDALSGATPYDEFIIASGDSDMTPLLVRLRAADRRTVIMSPSDAVEALASVADRLVNGQELLELLEDETDELAEELAVLSDTAPSSDRVTHSDVELQKAFDRFREVVSARYLTSPTPVNLASLASEVRREIGPIGTDSGWFASGGFSAAVTSLGLPHLVIDGHVVRNLSRHRADLELPPVVNRLSDALKIPRLPSSAWSKIYEVLATFLVDHEFSLSGITKWAREELANRGMPVSRSSIGFVVRASAFGGMPLYATPPPGAASIGGAVVRNFVDRADAVEIQLNPDDVRSIEEWFGAPATPAA